MEAGDRYCGRDQLSDKRMQLSFHRAFNAGLQGNAGISRVLAVQRSRSR